MYRKGAGSVGVAQIDPSLCTHLIYGFVGVESNGNFKVMDPWNDLQKDGGAYHNFVALKKKNPHLKTMVASGGFNAGSTVFSQMASNPGSRANFVRNAVTFVRKYGFDGLDIDWEYPNQRGGQLHDKV